MSAMPVEWALVIYYGSSAHRATYGRLDGRNTKYTKDYIQLSRSEEFAEALSSAFAVEINAGDSVPLTYRWPTGEATGGLVFQSSDRPHLKWETREGAPRPWRMSPAPNAATAETIPGNSSHLDFESAERELELIKSRGAGQPYLVAIKLRGEARTLHLRTYLANPTVGFAWANIALIPTEIQQLAAATSQRKALAWTLFSSGGVLPSRATQDALVQLVESEDRERAVSVLGVGEVRALVEYLRLPAHGLFFDPSRNHDAWLAATTLPTGLLTVSDEILSMLEARWFAPVVSDITAEAIEVDDEDADQFRAQIVVENYEVPDSVALTKVRGAAQRAFAEAVKRNYGFRCAITDIETAEFIVASHIVPWSEDQTIRLDPSNGICLSLVVDRAFENGYLLIQDDLTITVDFEKVANDPALKAQLEMYDGKRVRAPTMHPPRPEYLLRRRERT